MTYFLTGQSTKPPLGPSPTGGAFWLGSLRTEWHEGYHVLDTYQILAKKNIGRGVDPEVGSFFLLRDGFLYMRFYHILYFFFDGLYYHRIHHLKPPSKGEDVLMVHWFTKFPNRFESQIQADHFRTVMLGTRGLLTWLDILWYIESWQLASKYIKVTGRSGQVWQISGSSSLIPEQPASLKLVGWMIHVTHLTGLNRAVLPNVGFRKSCVWSWGGVIWKRKKT